MTCVPNREYCQLKTKKCSSSTLVEILFMFSFGVAHPDDPFPIAETFSKGKQTQIWLSEKRSTLWSENNMDALTVLSIWDTGFLYSTDLPSVLDPC